MLESNFKNRYGRAIDPNNMDGYEQQTFEEWFKKYHGYELNKAGEPVVWGVESLKAMYLAGMREQDLPCACFDEDIT